MRGNSTLNPVLFLCLEVAESGAPDLLPGVEGREHYRLVVNACGVPVDGGSGLGAEIAVAGIEVECADIVGAVGASELHAALDASDGVEALHRLECSPLAAEGKARWWGSEGNEEEDSKRERKWKISPVVETPCEFKVSRACEGSFDCADTFASRTCQLRSG